MSNIICNAPFCQNTIAKKSYVYCWVHRAERQKFNIKRMELVMPLWSVKNCKVHGHLRYHETIASYCNPSGNNSPRCKKCKRIKHPYDPVKMKSVNEANRGKRREQQLARLFKITMDDYNSMLALQNNLCAICEKPQSKFQKGSDKIRALAVDHNHTTGKVRALLCTSCNTAIGLIQESIPLAYKIIEYLRHHETT